MGLFSEQIYTVHEKLEAAEPAERSELVREGFCVWAFAFNLFWLLWNRLWLASAGYFTLMVALALFAKALDLHEETTGILNLLVNLLLGVHGRDLIRARLRARGYREVGVIVADSAVHAEQRYYAHVS